MEKAASDTAKFRWEHGVEIGAPAREAFRLIADFASWPSIFSFCRSARSIQKEGLLEVIELEIDCWDSTRLWQAWYRLDPMALSASFGQVVPYPRAFMTTCGKWEIRPGGPGSCRVFWAQDFHLREVARRDGARSSFRKRLLAAERRVRSTWGKVMQPELAAFKKTCEAIVEEADHYPICNID